MTKPHPHADKIIQLANDPTQDAWYKTPGGRWQIWELSVFPSFEKTWDWHVGHTPPEEPEVFTFSYTGPAPWRVEPELGTKTYSIEFDGSVRSYEWRGSPAEKSRLAGGNCWKTEADALAFASAFKAAAVGEKK